jgi:hypothetical protein
MHQSSTLHQTAAAHRRCCRCCTRPAALPVRANLVAAVVPGAHKWLEALARPQPCCTRTAKGPIAQPWLSVVWRRVLVACAGRAVRVVQRVAPARSSRYGAAKCTIACSTHAAIRQHLVWIGGRRCRSIKHLVVRFRSRPAITPSGLQPADNLTRRHSVLEPIQPQLIEAACSKGRGQQGHAGGQNPGKIRSRAQRAAAGAGRGWISGHLDELILHRVPSSRNGMLLGQVRRHSLALSPPPSLCQFQMATVTARIELDKACHTMLTYHAARARQTDQEDCGNVGINMRVDTI